MEKLNKVIADLEELIRPDYECMGCPCRAYQVERDALELLRELSSDNERLRGLWADAVLELSRVQQERDFWVSLLSRNGRPVDMDDLIRRSDVLKELKRWEWGLPEHEVECAVAAVPAVDAVEVVRCEERKHRAIGDDVCIHPTLIGSGVIAVERDDFCSYGERKRR